jgi:hypothetical protein
MRIASADFPQPLVPREHFGRAEYTNAHTNVVCGCQLCDRTTEATNLNAVWIYRRTKKKSSRAGSEP